jgi:hypothetical protein
MGRPILEMDREIFVEEYQDFVRMGLSLQEISRSFGLSVDALWHRLKRAGVSPLPVLTHQDKG